MKRVIIRLAIVMLLVAALVVPFAPAVSAAADTPTYAFSTIDYPGSIVTAPWGINAAGDIVGAYVVPGERAHGFVLSEGFWTTVDVNSDNGTTVIGIGPSGEIVGDYQMPTDPAWKWRSFHITKQGEVIDPVFGDHASTVPVRVLPDGTIIGWVQDAVSPATKYGVVLTPDGVLTKYDSLPNSQLNSGTPNGKTLVGTYKDAQGVSHGFILENSVRGPDIDFPAQNVATTAVQEINPAGNVISGYYVIAGVPHGFVAQRRGASGWAFRTVDVPNALITVIRGANAGGALVGQYQDSSFKWHGFLATPVEP